MQTDPLLVKLDWVFASSNWAITYLATFVQPLSKPVSNHIRYTIHIGSNIPRSHSFIFENFWVELLGFFDIVALHWNNSSFFANATKNLSSRLKQVRSGLRKWSKNVSKLSKLIYNCNWVLMLIDGLEDQRALSDLEICFRTLVKNHLSILLESKRIYWRQRNIVRWG